MSGRLSGDSVVVDDQREASQVYNRGNFGYPVSGGGIELDLIEAAFLLETGRLEVTRGGSPVGLGDLSAHASLQIEDFDTKYLVYRDLRQRGFVVKPSSGDFHMKVYPRGGQVSDSEPVYGVIAVSERAVAEIGSLFPPRRRGDRKTLYAVADEEGDITYYVSLERDPKGNCRIVPDTNTEGVFLGDRAFVFDAAAAAEYVSAGFYGKDLGGILQLSAMEAHHLCGNGLLALCSADGKPLSLGDIEAVELTTQGDFPLRMRVYSDLRARGLIPKTGFKYGTHFRAYEGHPDTCHAKYLVHCIGDGATVAWPELSRTVRLSGGVKKEILMAVVGDGIRYLELRWFRP
ncbi:MAG: tRNA-intron lyase [Thermoplasmatales archaeon]|nr:tRNA-intron lyase [Thermoplasmatales archaeon]